jgi:hypothetical protein
VTTNSKPRFRDISSRSHQLGRNSSILYRNRNPKGDDPASYYGLIRIADGQTFWAYIWPRLVNGNAAVELRLKPKT